MSDETRALPRSLLVGAAVFSVVAVGAGLWMQQQVDDARRQADAAMANASIAINQANQALSTASSAKQKAELAMLSAATRSPTPVATPPAFDPVVRSGTVAETTGAAPVAKGVECTVTVLSADGGSGLNCRVEVTCAGNRLYGNPSSGYLVCNITEGKPTFGRDDKGTAESRDPMIDLDLPKGTVVVSEGPTPEFRVTVELVAPS